MVDQASKSRGKEEKRYKDKVEEEEEEEYS